MENGTVEILTMKLSSLISQAKALILNILAYFQSFLYFSYAAPIRRTKSSAGQCVVITGNWISLMCWYWNLYILNPLIPCHEWYKWKLLKIITFPYIFNWPVLVHTYWNIWSLFFQINIFDVFSRLRWLSVIRMVWGHIFCMRLCRIIISNNIY